MSVTEQDVRNIAHLARLGIDDARLTAMVQELNGILAHMDALQRVDISESAMDLSPTHGMPLRADRSGSVPLTRGRDEFAPAFRDGFFLVPRLDTHSDAATSVGEDDA